MLADYSIQGYHNNVVIFVSFTQVLHGEEIFATGRKATCVPLGLSRRASVRCQSQLLDLVTWTPQKQVLSFTQLCEPHEAKYPLYR